MNSEEELAERWTATERWIVLICAN